MSEYLPDIGTYVDVTDVSGEPVDVHFWYNVYVDRNLHDAEYPDGMLKDKIRALYNNKNIEYDVLVDDGNEAYIGFAWEFDELVMPYTLLHAASMATLFETVCHCGDNLVTLGTKVLAGRETSHVPDIFDAHFGSHVLLWLAPYSAVINGRISGDMAKTEVRQDVEKAVSAEFDKRITAGIDFLGRHIAETIADEAIKLSGHYCTSEYEVKFEDGEFVNVFVELKDDRFDISIERSHDVVGHLYAAKNRDALIAQLMTVYFADSRSFAEGE